MGQSGPEWARGGQRGPEGAKGGQRGPEGGGNAMTIGQGAGMVQMGSYWVEFETDEAVLRTQKIDMWPEGA